MRESAVVHTDDTGWLGGEGAFLMPLSPVVPGDYAGVSRPKLRSYIEGYQVGPYLVAMPPCIDERVGCEMYVGNYLIPFHCDATVYER